MEYFCPFCRQPAEAGSGVMCCDGMRDAQPIDRWLVTRDVLDARDRLAGIVARGEAEYLFPSMKT